MSLKTTTTAAPFWLDLHSQEIGRGTSVVHRLRPKTAAVLGALLAQPGQVVAKATLLEAVWPDTFVSEAALTVCINELRQALGDSARAPRYLETVSKRGYRWIGPLPTAPPSAPVAPTGESGPLPHAPKC